MRATAKYSDLADLLRQEYSNKKRINPRYSLRAYARFLEIDNSRLSKILRGRRPINPKLIAQFGRKLGLSPKQVEELEACASVRRRKAVPKSNRKWSVLPKDGQEVIQDWHHDAILELMKLSTFQPAAQWVAKALDIPVAQAESRIDRLVRVGILDIRDDGSWHSRSEGFHTLVTGVNDTSASKRELQKRILQKSIEVLETVPIEERDHSAVMMATHTSKIIQAKFMIEKFRREFCEFMEDCPEKNVVYESSFSLFPVIAKQNGNQGGLDRK